MGFIRHDSRVVLRGRYGAPSTPSELIRVQSDKEWQAALVRGATDGLRRYDLGEYDPDAWEEKKRRAIGPDFVPTFDDSGNRLGDWTPKFGKQAKALREERLVELKAEKAELDAKVAAGEDLNDEEKEDLLDLKDQIAQLQKVGWLEESPDAFGDGVSGLYHSCSVDGVPSEYLANFEIGEDDPFSLRLFFWKLRENGEFRWEWEWGWWRIVFTNANSAELQRLNEELTVSQRDKLEAQLDALLDRGRLTVDDNKYIREQKERAAGIKQAAKDAGRSTDEYTTAEKAELKAIEKAIDARRKAKRGQTAADAKKIRDLRKKLYRDTATINFYQASKDFFNQALTITVIPDNRGYVTFVLGEQTWTYEDKTLRETGYRGTVWPNSKPRVRCGGGSYKWQIGAPEFETDVTLLLARRRLNSNPFGRQWHVVGDWDGGDDVDVQFRVLVVEGTGGNGIPPEVDFLIDFKGNGKKGARLHRATFFLPAGEREDDEAEYFDSSAPENLDSRGDCYIEDVEISYDEERDAQTLTVTLHNPDGVLGLDDATARMASVWIEDEIDGELQMVQMEARGICKTVREIKSAAPPSEENPSSEKKANTRTQLVIADAWALMDGSAIRDEIEGDGMTQGLYLQLMLANRGEKPSEYAGIDPTAGKVLGKPPKVVKGKTLIPLRDEARFKPAENAMRGAWLRHIETQTDERALRLGAGLWSFPRIIDDPVVAEFVSDPSYDGRYQILDQLDLPDDTSGTTNCFQVSGRKNPKTGERITLTKIVHESIHDKNDLRYVGVEKWLPLETDDALEDEEDILERLDFLASKHCLAVKMVKVETFFHTAIRPKRKVKLNGVTYRVKTISSSSMARDRTVFVARRVVE